MNLGSSNVVTNRDGDFYEQIEYFPYGETWVHNKSSETGYTTPYKFTAKEFDSETGLYYYGARYYDARLSRWISADPILNMYLDGKPGGGVFDPINLTLYHYCANNPVIYTDPTGMKHTDDGRLVNTGLSIAVNVNQDKSLSVGDQNSTTLYNIVQATHDGSGTNQTIKDAVTGEDVSSYSAGHFYVNMEGTIYDISGLALPTKGGATVYNHLTAPTGDNGDKTKFTQSNLPTAFAGGAQGVTAGSTQGRLCPWLNSHDIEHLQEQGPQGAALAQHLTNSDNELNAPVTRNIDAMNWRNDLIGLRGAQYINGNYQTHHRPFHNVAGARNYDGASLWRLNNYTHHVRHLSD